MFLLMLVLSDAINENGCLCLTLNKQSIDICSPAWSNQRAAVFQMKIVLLLAWTSLKGLRFFLEWCLFAIFGFNTLIHRCRWRWQSLKHEAVIFVNDHYQLNTCVKTVFKSLEISIPSSIHASSSAIFCDSRLSVSLFSSISLSSPSSLSHVLSCIPPSMPKIATPF